VRSIHAAIAQGPLFSAMRESQRLLVLTLVWLAPAAAIGAFRTAGRIGPRLLFAAAVALAIPGLWGIGGRLQPGVEPRSWILARQAIDRNGGTVLALPWHRYLDLRVAAGRRVLNPLPDEFGGDVLASSDPELGPPHFENADPRERSVQPVLTRLKTGRPSSDDLAKLGVRWIALLHDADWARYEAALTRDPGLEVRVLSPDLDLYRVIAWRGPIVTAQGVVLDSHPTLRALVRVPPSPAAVWNAPGAFGWMRGFHPAGITPDGRISLPAGSGFLWYWPGILCVLSQSVLLIATIVAVRPRGRSYSR
jgi:hypothetical protein